MIYTYTINGLTVRTGDLLLTSNGAQNVLPGEFYRLLGLLVPGEVDHVVMYLGPGGRCIEAGPKGVNTFEMPGDAWDGQAMFAERGFFIDTLVGVVIPLEGRGLSEEEEAEVRRQISEFSLAQLRKPYNVNFFNPETEDAYYCTQLAYKAYQRQGIDLNTGMGIPDLPGTSQIVFPQEIWEGFAHRKVNSQTGGA